MAGKRALSLAAALVLGVALARSAPAQTMGEYSFEAADGAPRFTQTLRWPGDPNVLYYEFTLENAAGEVLAATKLEEPLVALNLGPGEYRYKLALYNLLGKRDLELPWRKLTVLKAEAPRVAAVVPASWFQEDQVGEVTLSGENLLPGATVALRRSAAAAAAMPAIIGKESTREGTVKVGVALPSAAIAPGVYELTITNPGGLSFTVPAAITVHRDKPVKVSFSVGSAPWIALYDSWYTEAWSGTFFPLGFVGRLSAYFLKRNYGVLGAEVSFTGRSMQGGSGDAVIDSTMGLIGANGLFKHAFSKSIAAGLRTGGGIAMSRHAFDYGGSNGAELYSLDPYASLGLSFLYFPSKRVFVETGIDWMHLFTSGFTEGGLQPAIAAGVLFR